MIHPANNKYLALPVVAGEAMKQGSILRFVDLGDGTGRLQAFKATQTTDVSAFGTFVAYYITPDSQDIDFIGAPDSSTFTINTATGIGGGTRDIASGTEFVALGGSKTMLVRVEKNSLNGVPSSLASWTASTQLKVGPTDCFLCLPADQNINVVAGMIVENDGASLVVLLA